MYYNNQLYTHSIGHKVRRLALMFLKSLKIHAKKEMDLWMTASTRFLKTEKVELQDWVSPWLY